MAILPYPDLPLTSASAPTAVLAEPIRLADKALAPTAVLLNPKFNGRQVQSAADIQWLWSALTPIAVLLTPTVLWNRAPKPVAVFPKPVIAKLPASWPRNVF